MGGLILRPMDSTGPWSWRWLLVDAETGTALADHQVTIDPTDWRFPAFVELDRYLWAHVDPQHRLAGETTLVEQVGAWVGAELLGPTIGAVIADWAPVTVTVQVPETLAVLPLWPWELAHAGTAPPRPLALQDVAFVYDITSGGSAGHAGRAGAAPGKTPVGDALRMLAVFSQPALTEPLALRRERHALVRLVRELTGRRQRRIELRVLQYGVTRETLAQTVREVGGWDLLHISCHGGIDTLTLEHPDGTPDAISTADLIGLLRPARYQVKLAVLSACQSAAATAAETLRWLGLDEPAQELEAQAAAEAGVSPQRAGTADRAGTAGGGGGLARGLVEAVGCAVLAMRYPVGDEFAVRLATELYARLLGDGQTVDAALRLALPAAAGPVPTPAAPPVSIATPVLLGHSAVGLALRPPSQQGAFAVPQRQTMAFFPAEPDRFVGRTAAMSRASAALAPASGRCGVLFHGMAGAGKTACALELAYRHEDAFAALVYWEAPKQPDEFGAALASLALALERQLPGFTMVDKIGTVEHVEPVTAFAPHLAELCERVGLLIVLDNLETLLSADGGWRDPRWPVLVGALTGHRGLSRTVLTSRIIPTGLGRDRLLVEPVHALPRDEATLLARELPGLRALLHADRTEPGASRTPATAAIAEAGPEQVDADRALVRRVLGVVQGHPKLLELADAAARQGRDVLEEQLVAAEQAAVGRGPALSAFFAAGRSGLDADGFVDTLTGWVTAAVAGLVEPAGLLLQLLCALEDDDRTQLVVEANWADVWHRLGRPGDPPPAGGLLAMLADAALVAVDSPPPAAAGTDADADGPGADGSSSVVTVLRVHPGVAEAVHAGTPEPVRTAVDAELAMFWGAMFDWAAGRAEGEAGQLVARAGVSAAPYLLRLHDWEQAGFLLEQAFFRDLANPGMVQAVLPLLRRIADTTGTPANLGKFGRALAQVDPAGGEQVLRHVLARAEATGDARTAAASGTDLIDLLRGQGRLAEALTVADITATHYRQAGAGRWAQAGNEAQRLQILYRMGQGEQVLAALDGPDGLLARLDRLPDSPDPTDTVHPWNIREVTLQIGAVAAVALGRWQQALDYNTRVQASKRRRGAGPHQLAGTRFNDHGPLIELGRLAEADTLLADCQQTFTDTGDITGLGKVFSARADLAATRGQHPDATRLEQIALRLTYT
ncbi:CHAT domain-containing protein, partial [Frankia sp. Cr2]|uniref:CHAT domain-containing protein n=1 Tax=Frankia sp. Cr2 TaxID=3073932 RepID=UPI002AD535BA